MRATSSGLLPAVLVTAADIQDGTAERQLLTAVTANYPNVHKPGPTWATRMLSSNVAPWASTSRPSAAPTNRGLVVQPLRRIIEHSFGWLMNHQHVARDCEALPAHSEALIHIAMISLMTRRLAVETIPPWRST